MINAANSHHTSTNYSVEENRVSAVLRKIAYSTDLLIPGIYLWLGNWGLALGGEEPDDEPYRYPGVIHSSFGFAVVFPGYHILTTYHGSYDPR